MSRRIRLSVVAAVVLGVAFLASLSMLILRSRQLYQFRQLRAVDLRSLQELLKAVRQRSQQKTPSIRESSWVLREQAAAAQRDATIQHLNLELSAAGAKVEQFQDQLANSRSESRTAIESVTKRGLRVQENLQSQLTALQQQVRSLEADSQAFRLRISSLEADNARLRTSNGTDSARSAAVSQILSQLEDLNKRRDEYLDSIMRRYRDITSQFRSMSGVVASGQTTNSDAFSGVALLRIENALASSDNDFRQMSDLNEQFRQLEAKLRTK